MKKTCKRRMTAAALAAAAFLLPVSVAAEEAGFSSAPYQDEVPADGIQTNELLQPVICDEIVTASACQTRQIIVFADELDSFYGAVEAEYQEAAGCYFLTFETEGQTAKAYAEISRDYVCMVDEILEADEVLESMSWGYDFMEFGAVNQPELSFSQECIVAIIDTGFGPFDTTDLFDGRILPGYDFAEDDADVTDDGITDPSSISYGHGTHVAGIIAECTPANVKILPIKIFAEDHSKSTLIIQAVAYALEQGADIINLSLGVKDPNHNKVFLDNLIHQAKEDGSILCCAAGNDNTDVATLYPSNHPDTMSVSALGTNGGFAYGYSNYGADIDFSAPGTDVVSTMPGGGYASKTGTSQAAPHVSAALAVLKSAFQDCSTEQLYNMAAAYCQDLGDSGKDSYYGNGSIRMDWFAADYLAGAIDPADFLPEEEKEEIWPFTDVAVDESSWIYQSVNFVYTGHIMTGMSPTVFGPANDVSRAQFATILYRMSGAPSVSGSAPFPDVAENLWYSEPVAWASASGVVNGYANGFFGPADSITREQMALMMYRYASALNLDVTRKADFSGYPDAGNVSDWAREAMQWAVGSGILTGKDGGTRLDPAGSASRAECATIIMRFLQNESRGQSL